MMINELQITNIHGATFSSASCNVDDIYRRTGNKNIYELVIDNLMLVKYSDDEELINYIKSLPLSKKRLAILSLMDDDQYSWDKLREKITGNKVSKIDHLKDLVKMFREFIKVAEVERKTHGEIMTPMDELARPMVDLVEKYDEDFWKNPNHKVLDSSAGIGTFLIICAAKFMNGLKDVEGFEDPEVRFKHIVEKCLYYGELQSRNAFLWLCAIDPYDEYKTNTYFGSFLDGTSLSKDFDTHMKDVWKVDKFDLIIQNPPYQVLKETDKNKNSKNPKTQPIWQLFVKNCISILREDKYMVMVHPGGWRDLDGPFKEVQNLLKERQMLYLNTHTFKDGLNLFKAKTNYDYYLLKNSKNNNTITSVICEDNSEEEINIKDLELIPGENISFIYNLIAKDGEDKVNILSNSLYHTQSGEKSGLLSKNKTDTHKYPCVYMVSYKNEPTFWYSNTNKGHFGSAKVIWANGSSGVITDKEGKYGLTQFSRAIIDDVENLEYIEKALKNQDFIDKVMLYKHGLGHKYNNKIISMLRKDFWKEFI